MRMLRLLLALAWVGSGPLTAAEPNEVYETHCASCHGLDGRARTPQGRKLKARDLKDSRLSNEELIRRIREGSRTPKGTWLMPAFADQLTLEEIEAAARTARAFRPDDAKSP